MGLLGVFVWRDYRRGWRWPARFGPARPAPDKPPAQELLPPAPVDDRPPAERLQTLGAALETQAEQSAHPRDLLLFADFQAAVGVLADPRCDLELVRHYAAGRLWTLSSAAFEALRRRPDRQQLADLGISQLRTHSPGALHYCLRFLNSLDPRPPSGDPTTIAQQWWVNHAMLIETFRDYFEERAQLGDPPAFGELAQAPGVELDHVESFLKRVDHPYASALLGELARWRSTRIDEAKLTSFGRFWSREPDNIIIEPAPWSSVLDTAEAAVLGQRHRSILVTGGPRVGKSSFLRLLGRRLADQGWRVFEATAAELMADQMYIGQLEGRIRETVAELLVGKKVAWCIGDLQQLARSGTHSGQSASVLDQMWPAIAGGRLLILAEADPDGASRTLQMRPALRAHLEVVRLFPFDEVELAQFARRVADRLQDGSPVSIRPDARDAALHYGQQYLRASGAPGVVADILKRAADRAASGRDEVETPVVVGAPQVIEAVAQMTGLPADILDEDDPIDLGQVRAYFSRKVMGQDHAVSVVVDRIAMLKAGLVDPNKPIGVFLFAGPTGTGKTELAKTLAAFLFGSADRLIRLDMSEFQSAEAVSKIVGERGQFAVGDPLVEQVRKQPFSVVLLDEFEKAHANVWDLFLQVFDDGRLTDANGHTADFRHAIIILTSNLGATGHRSSGMGFSPSKGAFSEQQVVVAVEKAFRPEFVNRLDRVVVFRPLTRELLYRILHKELADVLERRGLRNREWAVEWEPSALDFLLDRGFSPELGARPLKRAIDQYLLAPLAATLVEHRFPEGDQFLFVRSHGNALEVEFVDPDGVTASPASSSVLEPDRGDEPKLADLVLHPAAASDNRTFLLRRCEALEAQLESNDWLQRKAKIEQRASAPDIWDSADRVAVFSALNLIDRVKEASSTVKRLAERLKPSGGLSDRRSPDLSGRLALQLWLVENGVQDVVSGAPGEVAVMVESALEGAADRAESQAWVKRVLGMYGAWAQHRRMQFRLLAPAGQPAILSISGFGAWRTLSAEAGLHVLESDSGDSKRLTARVRVAGEPEDEAAPSHAQLLRALKATPAGRSVVRRYRDGEAPLVRDTITGKRSGQLDQVLGGAFDLVFDTGAEAATAKAEPGY